MPHKVLLAEDVGVDPAALRTAFAPLGFEVRQNEGALAAEAEECDCVIIGHQTWMGQRQALLARLSSTPMVVISSVADAALVEQAIAQGVDDFIDDDILDARGLARTVRNAVARRAAQRSREERQHREVLAAVDHLASCLAHGINNPATFMTHNLGFLREAIDRLVSLMADLQLLVSTETEPLRPNELHAMLERQGIAQLCGDVPLMVEDTAHGMSRIIELVRQLHAFQQLPLAPRAAQHVDRLAESILANANILQDASPLAEPVERDNRTVVQLEPALTTVDLVRPDDGCPCTVSYEPKPLRILAIDDEVLILSAIRRMLREHHVILANGGKQALDAIRASRDFDGILCDLMMPEVDGEAFHHALKTLAPELVPRVAYFTGGTFTEDMQAFVRSLPNPVLDKPLQPQEILTLTQRWTSMNRHA